MEAFEAKHRPALEALLAPGESLAGVCAASQRQGLFKGRVLALGVTDRRLVLLPLDRRGEPQGEPESVALDEVASAKGGGAGGAWWNGAPSVMDRVALELTIKTTAGEKLKLAMMRGGSALGGGESQRAGVAALADWLGRATAGR